MKIAVLMDAFKGTLTSIELARMVQARFSALGHEVRHLSVSDGGEGFLDVFKTVYPSSVHRVPTKGPLGKRMEAEYVLEGKEAFIGLHTAAGLSLVHGKRSSPAKTSTYGVGVIIRDAVQKGAERIVLGLGGSVTIDGGAGLLQALGVRFLRRKSEIEERMNGGRLLEVTAVDDTAAHDLLEGVEFLLAADVRAPLLGPTGAAHMYARQKGASEEEIALLERAMGHFADLIAAHTGRDLREEPGVGAAGGVGFGVLGLLKARIVKGIDLLVARFDIESLVAESDIVIVGEGRLDEQTAQGKAPHKLAHIARRHGKYVIGLFGSVEENPLQGLIDEIHAVVPLYADEKEAMLRPAHYFQRMLEDIGRFEG